MLKIKDIILGDDAKETLFDSYYKITDEDWKDICEDYGYNKDDYDQKIEFMNYMVEDEMSIVAQLLSTIELKNNIISIAQLGLWNCSSIAYYKEYERVENILYTNSERCKILINDNNELYKVTSHHDGTNYEWLRVWRAGVNDNKKDKIKDKIYNGEITLEDIKKYTKPLRILKKHYR